MEVEAKFLVPDEETFRRLSEARDLAGFRLGEGTAEELHDEYLDTAAGALWSAGYALRLRETSGAWRVALKGLGAAEDGVHRREELEADIAGRLAISDWPAGRVRDRVLQVCGDQPLRPIMRIAQTRYNRPVLDGDRPAAVLSLDRVLASTAGPGGSDSERQPPDRYLELEVELLPQGMEADLRAIGAELTAGWGLSPKSTSKFERALERAGHHPFDEEGQEPSEGPHLTAAEKAQAEWLAGERAVLSRRARMLLAWDDGQSVGEMLARSGLSERRARYWRWAFRQRRMAIFPKRALAAAADGAAAPERRARRRARATVASTPSGPPPSPAAEPAAGGAPAALRRPGIEAGDEMAEAGRKTLRFHFRRMLEHEPGTRQGDEIEALHDMRVATRRMRAAFGVFGAEFVPETVGSLLRGLRRTGRGLGAVRDLDVFRDRVQAYLQGLPPAQRGCLDAFRAELEARREAARRRLIEYLDSGRYRRFVERMEAFVETPGMGSLPSGPSETSTLRPRRVRWVVPMIVYERLAEVRAYDEWVTVPDPPLPTLHALRISCKRLRYTLEYFQEVLAPAARDAVKAVVAAQDHLGLIQDGVVASSILRDYLVWGTWGPEVEGKRLRGDVVPVIAPGVAIYLAARQVDVQSLVQRFPDVWHQITGEDLSRAISQAVSVL